MNIYALTSLFSSIVCLTVGVLVYQRDNASATRDA